MIETEKLEDILHKEKMDELQREIDELPDYHTENEIEFIKACYELKSLDLVGRKPHLTQTAWREKHLTPKSELKIYASKTQDLKILQYLYIAWGVLSLLFCYTLLWYISASY